MKAYYAALQAEQGANAENDATNGRRLLTPRLKLPRQNYEESEAPGLF